MQDKEQSLTRPLVIRVRGWWGKYHLPILFVAGVVSVVLGMIGFRVYHSGGPIERSWTGAFYRSIQLFGLESGAVLPPLPWQLQVARFAAPLITISALLTGLVGIFEGELRGLWLSLHQGHTVLCGLGRRSNWLLRRELAAGRRVVVIERNPHNRFLPFCQDFGVHVIEGDGEDPNTLRKARLRRASRLIVCTGKDNQNLEIVACASDFLAPTGSPAKHRLEIWMHLADRQTRGLFRQQRVFSGTSGRIDLRLFDVYENAARRLWEGQLGTALRGAGDGQRPHLVLIGLGQLGIAVLCEVVGKLKEVAGSGIRLSLIDRCVKVVAGKMGLDGLDLEGDHVRWIEGDLDTPETMELVISLASEAGVRPVIVVCMDDDYLNVAHALQLAHRMADRSVPIFIRVAEAEGLAGMFASETSDSSLARQISTFGLIRECVELEELV